MTVRILILLFLLLAPCACTPSRGVYHTVREGQTLYRISRVYGVDERYLARINRIDDPALLPTGARLYIPGAAQVREVPVVSVPAAVVAPKPSAAKAPAAVKGTSSAPTPKGTPPPVPVSSRAAASPALAAAGKPSAAVKGKFGWPLKGKLIRGFGSEGNPPSRGVEIAVGRGTPIRSAAAGRVIYSGDGIRSYGNLIILKHDDSFFTVYGFNQKNMVDAGAFVSKGEQIALSGGPPTGGTPRLYFEIRCGKEPVNPIFYLP